MKKILLTLLLFVFSTPVHAQEDLENAYRDKIYQMAKNFFPIALSSNKNSIEKFDEIMTRASVDFLVNINDLYTLADLNKEHCVKNEFSDNGFID